MLKGVFIMKISRPPFFPMFIDLYGREVLIIGGGNVASRRAETLMRCGAEITAVSPRFCEKFPVNAKKILRGFQITDITENFVFIVAASNNHEINRLVHDTAKSKGILVNVADSQSESDFFFPSLINHGNIAVSVNSAGTSSRLTKILSDRLRSVWSSWIKDAEDMTDI